MSKSLNAPLHYKMYKSGKSWVFTGIVSAGLVLAFGGTIAQADTTDTTNTTTDPTTTTEKAPAPATPVTSTPTVLNTPSAPSTPPRRYDNPNNSYRACV